HAAKCWARQLPETALGSAVLAGAASNSLLCAAEYPAPNVAGGLHGGADGSTHSVDRRARHSAAALADPQRGGGAAVAVAARPSARPGQPDFGHLRHPASAVR